MTHPLQISPVIELRFAEIWKRRQDGTQTVYAGIHHWALTNCRDRVGQRGVRSGCLSELAKNRGPLLF